MGDTSRSEGRTTLPPFAVMMEALPLATAAFDRDMRYLAHSRSWFAAHGVDEPGSVVGKSHYEVFPFVDDEWRAKYARCLAGARESGDLNVYSSKDGGVEHIRWQITPWSHHPGTVEGLIIYADNISEQVRTQQRLRERESLIRDLFEQSPVGLNLCTLEGIWLESNKAFCDIIGYTEDEANGLTYWQLTPRRYDAQEEVQLQKLRTIRRYGPYEREFIRISAIRGFDLEASRSVSKLEGTIVSEGTRSNLFKCS